jgi:hypothetical protein
MSSVNESADDQNELNRGVQSDLIPDKTEKANRFQIGPGFGMVIMGISYIWWWVMPWAWESYTLDNRWAHNWAYAIIIFTIGLAWYQKTPLSRSIALVQGIMMPITASGSVNTLFCTFVTMGIFTLWLIVVIMERKKKVSFLTDKLDKRSINWLTMHTLILAWILVGHMGLVFFLGRAPFESQLLNLEALYAVRPAYLSNLPPEINEFATWTYDISLTIWMILVIYEQFKMGYNPKNKPWPRWSFWWTIFGLLAMPLIALAIQFA